MSDTNPPALKLGTPRDYAALRTAVFRYTPPTPSSLSAM
jgi:hypothetical protein